LAKSKVTADLEEIRFNIIKAMLEEFPELKKRVKEYLEKDAN